MAPENTGIKTDFSHFVNLALQDRMTWQTLAVLLNNFAPTLNKTKEVISILLKELETLHLAFQKNQEEIRRYQNHKSVQISYESNKQEFFRGVKDDRINAETQNKENTEEMAFETIEGIKRRYEEGKEIEIESQGEKTHDKKHEIDTFLSIDKEGMSVECKNLLNPNKEDIETCNKKIKKISTLKQQEKVHKREEKLECTTCNRIFKRFTLSHNLSCAVLKGQKLTISNFKINGLPW